MIYFVLFSCVLHNVISTDTCLTGGGGPCFGGDCTAAGAGFPNCVVDPNDPTIMVCCADAEVVTVTSTTTTTTTTSSSNSSCSDRLNPVTGVSDCPSRAYLCNDAVYYDVMTNQCPYTCGRCSSVTTTASGSCVDRLNPVTGVSDCTRLSYLCSDSTYYTVMKNQCPKTCGFCSSSSTTTSSTTTCVDQVNPSTGVSECAARASLCTNSVYRTLMTQQCPKTCGFC